MRKVYIYITNGEIHIETPEREVLHVFTGFKSTKAAYDMIDNLKNQFDVIEIFS